MKIVPGSAYVDKPLIQNTKYQETRAGIKKATQSIIASKDLS